MHEQDHIEKKGTNFWGKHVEQYQQSKQSKSSYCKQHNLTYHRFIYWSSKLTSCSEESDTLSPLIAVTLLSQCNKSAEVASVTLPNGIKFVRYEPWRAKRWRVFRDSRGFFVERKRTQKIFTRRRVT